MSIETEILEQLTGLVGRRDLSQLELNNWLGGAINGGPEGNGLYPLTDGSGFTRMVASPAKLAAEMSGSVGPLQDLPDATIDDAGADNEMVGVTPAGVVKKFTTNLFASRRTVDLEPVSSALTDDLLQITRLGTDKQLEIGAILALLNNNYINLSSAPYNVVADFQEQRGCITTSGSVVLDSPDPIFLPSDVGKMLLVSNALTTGGGPMATTIAAVVSPYRVNMANAANRTFEANRIGFGTDNTVGLRQAFLDAEPVGQFQMGKVIIVPGGGILTRPQRIRARTTIFGYGDRVSYFVRAPGLVGGTGLDQKNITWFRNAIIANNVTDGLTGKFYPFADDFISIINVGFNGGRYLQPGGDFTYTLELHSILGAAGNLAQVDPYWRVSLVSVFDGAGHGFHTFGRSSSNMGFINVQNCNGMGWFVESFDDNVNTLVTIANGQTGLYLGANGGSAGNFTTVKSSYNGENGTGNRIGTNVTIDGSNYIMTGMRLQESKNSNLTIRGTRNKIIGGTIEDTGCIAGHAGHGSTQPAESIRSAIFMVNGAASGDDNLACYGNLLQGVKIGPAVHQNNIDGQHASHDIWLQGTSALGGPQYNDIDVRTIAPFGRIDRETQVVTPWSYQDYGAGAGPTGKNGFASFDQNKIYIDRELVADGA